MKRFLTPASLALAALIAAACSEPANEAASVELPTIEASSPSPVIAAPAPVDGWNNLAPTTPALLDENFSVAGPEGAAITASDLRERWTILAFWGLWSEDSIADVRYMQALRTAAAQDPGLDFLAIHTPPPRADSAAPSEAPYGAYLSLAQGLDDQGAPFPTAEDTTGDMAHTLGLTSAPTYLLIGPDLAIEAQRGALAPDATDGIKSMIRGVAEIKRQIAAP